SPEADPVPANRKLQANVDRRRGKHTAPICKQQIRPLPIDSQSPAWCSGKKRYFRSVALSWTLTARLWFLELDGEPKRQQSAPVPRWKLLRVGAAFCTAKAPMIPAPSMFSICPLLTSNPQPNAESCRSESTALVS